MVRLDLGSVVLRRMKLDDIEAVKALIKEGCEGMENRLILNLLTRPLALLMLAILSSMLRCVLHSFILAMVIPVFLCIIYLKLTMARSTGILGSSKPYWDYVGSTYLAEQDSQLDNPYSKMARPIGGKLKAQGKPKRTRKEEKDKVGEAHDMEDLKDRARVAGDVWVADVDGEVIACLSREPVNRSGITRVCRVVVQSWYRREGVGRLLVQGLSGRERERGCRRIYAHVPFPSRIGEAFFRKLGFHLQGEVADGEEERDVDFEEPQKGWLGFPVTRVFVRDI